MAALVPLFPTSINLSVDVEGIVVHSFSPCSPQESSSLFEFVDEDDHDQLRVALQTKSVVTNFFRFILPNIGRYITTLTPSQVTGNVFVLAHPVPDGSPDDGEHDPRGLHRLKGVHLAFESIAARGSLQDLQTAARKEIIELGRSLSPYHCSPPAEAPFFKTLPQLIHRLSTIYSLQCAHSGREFIEPTLPATLAPILDGSAADLHLILDNLLSNAVKYSTLGGVVKFTIVSLGETSTGSTITLRFEVANSAETPLAQELKERVFAAGDRLDLTDEDIEGTGIGLNHSKEIANEKGWTLDYEPSIDPPGTTFFLEATLSGTPSSLVPTPEAALPAFSIEPLAKPRDKLRVVFIEDEPITALIGETILTKRIGIAGENIQHTQHYREALELCLRKDIDVFITDDNINGGSGRMLIRLRRLYEEQELLRRIPCILTSATPLSLAECQRDGATGFMGKPFDIKELVALFDHFLPHRSES